jgi:hypothetical protein
MTTAATAPTDTPENKANVTTALVPAADAAAEAARVAASAGDRYRRDDPNLDGSISVFASSGNFDAARSMAKALSNSTVVPAAYQGEKGFPNCLIAIEMASRMGSSVLAVMQHLNVIKGKPGWDATFLIASVNTSKEFGRMKFKFVGERGTDEWGCYAYAKDLEDGEVLIGATITIKMTKDEGWYTRDGSKWPTMPEQMLMYRAASFWTRVYAPEKSMGMHSADELEDIGPQPPLDPTKLADLPHADTANTGRRMSLGKTPNGATAVPIQDAVTVPPTPPEAAQSTPERSGAPSAAGAGATAGGEGDASSERELDDAIADFEASAAPGQKSLGIVIEGRRGAKK